MSFLVRFAGQFGHVKKFLTGMLTMALALSTFASVAQASHRGYTYFGVGVNNYPDHEDYSQTENIPNAYVNVYLIDEDSSGTYKGTLVQTAKTGVRGGVDVIVYEGELVAFIGFLSLADASSSQYKTHNFESPPYKNFGTADRELCQTHFFEFDQFLNYSQDYACTTGLSTPYQVINSEETELTAPYIYSPSMDQVLTNYPRIATLEWSWVEGAAKYEVELSCDICWSATNKWQYPGYDYSYNNWYTTPALWGNNEFRFRVRAIDSDGNYGPWSSYSYFRYENSGYVSPNIEYEPSQVVDAEDTKLTAPYIYSPRMDQVLTNYPRIATLEWSGVEGASQYEIEITCDFCGSGPNKWQNPSYYYSYNNWYTISSLVGDNEFRFRVRAIDSDGNYGPWSSYSYFSYDTSGYVSPIEYNLKPFYWKPVKWFNHFRAP